MNPSTQPGRFPGLLAAALAILLAACGGTPVSTAAPDANSSEVPAPSVDSGATVGDLCALVPPELAEAAMGGSVSDGEGGDLFPDGSFCVFGTDAAAVRVEVQVVEMTREAFDARAGDFGLTESVSGVGEAAFVRQTSVQGEVGSWLYAYGNGLAVGVDVQGPDEQAAQLEAMRAIVEAVLSGW
jgi:hypothetical protein